LSRKILLPVAALASACQIGGPQSTSPRALPPDAPPLARPFRAVEIIPAQGTVPRVTISVPEGWRHQATAGEDSMSHLLSGNGVTMRFRYWGTNTNLACRQASCGLEYRTVDGRKVEIVRARGQPMWRAFVPLLAREGPGPAIGLQVSADCASLAGCEQALSVLNTVRAR